MKTYIHFSHEDEDLELIIHYIPEELPAWNYPGAPPELEIVKGFRENGKRLTREEVAHLEDAHWNELMEATLEQLRELRLERRLP